MSLANRRPLDLLTSLQYRLEDWFHDPAADFRSDKVHYTVASPSSSRFLAGVANEESPSVKLAPRGIVFPEACYFHIQHHLNLLMQLQCDVKLTPELCVVLGYMMAFEAGLDAGHDQRE